MNTKDAPLPHPTTLSRMVRKLERIRDAIPDPNFQYYLNRAIARGRKLRKENSNDRYTQRTVAHRRKRPA